MRFLSDGPSIPDELLELRDQGNLVFLCGAGVSYPAGMPDFPGLARYVVDALGTPRDAQSREMLSMWDNDGIPAGARPSLDQIFNLLQQEYPASEVDYLIAKRLRTKPGANVSAHETVLRISKGVDGKPQLVTTNFDLLFEYACKQRIRRYVPPSLPDLVNGEPLAGLVYLHGRMDRRVTRGGARQGLVLSSSDFGRAYLAEGWATRFIRELLDRYTVILLGYSATDPPVRYLLQGLHTGGRKNQARLYAFDSGTEEEAQARWRDSGVHVLAYPATDCFHSKLWDTLSAWADRADDPEAWQERIVSLAMKGPRDLAAYERGQVASLVRTNTGSKLFAIADNPPPGEWLCVFDHFVRYGSVGESFDESSPPFDPLANYGLDDDPPRPSEESRFNSSPPGDDLLSSSATEHHPDQKTRLAGIGRECNGHLSPRMFHLARWIGRIAHQPVVPWWAARYVRLHPFLLGEIRRGVEHDELPTAAKRTWQILLEKFHGISNDLDPHWHEMCSRIKVEGWKNILIREFDRKSTPYISTERPFGVASSRPPDKEWPMLRLSDITRFEVAFPGYDAERPEIPDAVLPKIYQIVRRHLEMAAGFLEDIDTQYWKTATFYPEDAPGRAHVTEASEYLYWFRDLLDRMVDLHSELVKADSALWPKEEPFFFNKLYLYAWSSDELFSGKEVADRLLAISDDWFWNELYRRELLHLLKRRWDELPFKERELLEKRIVNGPPTRFDSEPEEEYKRSSSITSARILGWLKLQGCELCTETLGILPRLRDADPRWCLDWDETADDSLSGRGGVVTVDTDPSSIIGVPVSQIIELARKHTQRPTGELTEFKPFDGLVAKRPSRAVAALRYEARRGEYPVEFWRSAIHAWPQDVRYRLSCLFADSLARLPSEIFIELVYEVFLWFSNHFRELAGQDQPRALSLLDRLLKKLLEGGPDATESGQGDTFVGGVRQNHSRKTASCAMNSPVGMVVGLLLDFLNSLNPGKGSSIQPEIKLKLETLIATPGEVADHAVCLLASDFPWLEHIDPKWAHSTILPWFQLDHPRSEAAWNGVLYDSKPKPVLFSLIKSDFMNMIVHATRSNWDDQSLQRLHEYLVLGCFWHKDRHPYITLEETREALQKTDDVGRVHALHFFRRLVGDKSAWNPFGKRFIENAWPRESRFQTAETSRQFVKLAEEVGDFFPEFVQTILAFLVPIEDHWSVYGIVRSTESRPRELPQIFPDATLALINKLVPENPFETPYELSTALDMIAEVKPQLRRDEQWLRLKNITLDD